MLALPVEPLVDDDTMESGDANTLVRVAFWAAWVAALVVLVWAVVAGWQTPIA